MPLSLTGYILKDAPEGIEKANEGEFWAVATAEVMDRSKDIVRVAGMSLEFHKAESPIKLLAQHLKKLPDGTSPVVGSIREFKEAAIQKDGGPVKALLFKGAWANSTLAKHYRELYDDGHMTDFSIGARVVKATPIKGGGTDYEQTVLSEVSCVTIGDNPEANRIVRRSLGDYLESEAEIDDLTKSVNDIKTILSSLPDLTKFISDLNDRLDVIESALVSKSDAEEPATADRKAPVDNDARLKAVALLESLLK